MARPLQNPRPDVGWVAHPSRKALIGAALDELSEAWKAAREAHEAYLSKTKTTARTVADLCVPTAIDIVSDHPEGITQVALTERVIEVLDLDDYPAHYVKSNLRASLASCPFLVSTREPRLNKANRMQPQLVWRL